ncbi:MAG: T9SS type A sorting domain-containing protein [Crocinitomix sp.]|nr:T9SS type A sorting domain-containing protein [Crocinitomix sp.]
MNTKRSLAILFLLVFNTMGFAQSTPFNVAIVPMEIEELGGLQAFSWGQADGKWLIVGGRLDGLHRRQPWAAFDEAGHNISLLVIDPVTKEKWSAPLTSLPAGMQEQLSATNMEFKQDGDFLYIVGGYGYSATELDHTTFAKLSAINVPNTIEAIINGDPFAENFRQIEDPLFQVTGGYLNKIYDSFYLTGGQKFLGRYNPMGPDFGPGFIQEYTNAIRKFNIIDDGVTLSIEHLEEIIDTVSLHRRDFNVVPQIMPSGEEGITAFSGVFQYDIELPFLNCVNIDSTGYVVNDDFTQYYNHYHCAQVPIYSEANNAMHTVFFGGIAQYYDLEGVLVQDNDVPFVKTIARVSRSADGTMAEYKLPINMPSLLGAGSEFIPITTVPQYDNEVFDLDEFTEDSTLVGYIYGGISSSAPNIFFTNTGVESSASSQIFKVYILTDTTLNLDELNAQSVGSLKLAVYPNPNGGKFTADFYLNQASDVKISLHNAAGKKIEDRVYENMPAGQNTYQKKIRGLAKSGVYFLTIETSYETATQKIIIAE